MTAEQRVVFSKGNEFLDVTQESRRKYGQANESASSSGSDRRRWTGHRASPGETRNTGACRQSQWASYMPVWLDNVISAVSATGATLVYIDNNYMYAPTSQPLTEESLQAPVTRKGKLRKQLAETILAAHARGQIKATIGRTPDFYGPGVRTSNVGEQFFTAVVEGKRVPLPGPLCGRWSGWSL